MTDYGEQSNSLFSPPGWNSEAGWSLTGPFFRAAGVLTLPLLWASTSSESLCLTMSFCVKKTGLRWDIARSVEACLHAQLLHQCISCLQ